MKENKLNNDELLKVSGGTGDTTPEKGGCIKDPQIFAMTKSTCEGCQFLQEDHRGYTIRYYCSKGVGGGWMGAV